MILTIPQRNSLVQEHLWCIDSVSKQNYSLIKAARLDRDDVFQSLAMRLIRALELDDPNNKAGKTLKGYIFMNLRFALRTCSSAQAQYGFRNAPHYLPIAPFTMACPKSSPCGIVMRFWRSCGSSLAIFP